MQAECCDFNYYSFMLIRIVIIIYRGIIYQCIEIYTN